VAAGFVVASPTYFVATCVQVRMLGGRISDFGRALMPAYLSGLAMGAVVLILKLTLPFPVGLTRLVCLVAAGVIAYCGWILVFHRREVIETWQLISHIRAPRAADLPA
jgi:hypothetical protein